MPDMVRSVVDYVITFGAGVVLATAYWAFITRSPYRKCRECKGRTGKPARWRPGVPPIPAAPPCTTCGGKRVVPRWGTRLLPRDFR
jgi:hypothetical protein